MFSVPLDLKSRYSWCFPHSKPFRSSWYCLRITSHCHQHQYHLPRLGSHCCHIWAPVPHQHSLFSLMFLCWSGQAMLFRLSHDLMTNQDQLPISSSEPPLEDDLWLLSVPWPCLCQGWPDRWTPVRNRWLCWAIVVWEEGCFDFRAGYTHSKTLLPSSWSKGGNLNKTWQQSI